MAPVLRELNKYPERINSQVCITAQHRDLLDQVLELFDIRPDHDLDVMRKSQAPAEVASLILSKLDPILQSTTPDWVLVQGDTTTAMTASLAAFYARAKVGHVEAGLRTQDRWNPFPEEINRKIIGAIANFHYAPTESAKQNLMKEGVHEENILVTGNPGIDALLWVASQQSSSRDTKSTIEQRINNGDFKGFAVDKKTILVTAHRRENHGKPLENICLALKEIAERKGDDVQIIYPVHLSPAVQGPVHQLIGNLPNIILVSPVDYLSFVYLMQRAYLIMTDSGGIQEEASTLGKPILVLRNITERSETIEFGTGCLVGTKQKEIVKKTIKLLEDKTEYSRMAKPNYSYGDGQAAKRIVEDLLGENPTPFTPGTRRLI
jgi:UDP-N-acetylglucosamine 2-epimerase (non-hydrolysing)